MELDEVTGLLLPSRITLSFPTVRVTRTQAIHQTERAEAVKDGIKRPMRGAILCPSRWSRNCGEGGGETNSTYTDFPP